MKDEKNNFENNSPKADNKKDKKDHNSIIGGITLITLGVLFLIDRLVPNINFGDLWPILLIVIGILLLTKNNFLKPKKNKKNEI